MDNKIDINQKLEILYDLLVDNFETFGKEIKTLIANPERIKNTNKFASLLSDLKNPVFIGPLLDKINVADKTDIWLTDFLYATINLLNELDSDRTITTPDNLVEKLGGWIIGNTGELAWKAAGLLKFSTSAKAEKIQLMKLEERGDFFLVYVECILGLLWYDRSKHIELVKQIAKDESRDEKLREYCADLIKREQLP
jgi:hypothetical protein